MARAYAGCPSTWITRGRWRAAPDYAKRRKSLAAVRSRFGDSMKSIVSPAESTARYRYVRVPATFSRVGGGAQTLRPRWPPSAAQTARAVFPHAAFTKIPFRVGAREDKVRVS